MLNRTLALFLLSVSFYGAYVVAERSSLLPLGTVHGMSQGEDSAELLAQERPSNAPPHRGSGRCDHVC